jgi:hypothetical protein
VVPKPLADWTVMIYLGGDNNLSAECVWALTEMQQGMKDGGIGGNVNVIAQYDPNDGLARTRRYEITSLGVKPVQSKGVQQQSAAQAAPPPPLDAFVKDFAGWNPRTGEVHFERESRNAGVLADQRHAEIAERLRVEEAIVKKGQPVNAILTSDDFGSSINDTDAASPITLYNFLSFGIHAYPARHYLVIISGHSAGIEPSYLLRDDSSGGYMTFRQLRTVFDQLQFDFDKDKTNDGRASRIEVLGFDTCLMSMAEVCCGLYKCVDVVIGSETYTPSSGWPYRNILKRLTESSHDPYELAHMVVNEYVDFYRNYVPAGVSVSLSALNVNKSGPLAGVVKRLTGVLIKDLRAEHPELDGKREKDHRPLTDALVLAHWEAQSYNGEWYVDLIDFCECLMKRYSKPAVTGACKALITYLQGRDGAKDSQKFVIATDYCGPTYQYSNGVAIYFPWCSVASYFWAFDFATRSGWGDFLANYTNLTRRKFRVPPKEQLNSGDRKRIRELEQHGGNFLNYARKVKRTSDKRTSDKRASLDILVFNSMGSGKRTSDKMASDKRTSDKMASDKMASDKMASDKMGSDKSGNPIHSMRNPPIVSLDFEF